ncbi:MAG TPA: fatty acid cis/trans isomerase, partial [Spongiibacteraceae bacterium]|nr:fatty acid cis/trans isomerase [Spongiibacteraceae bacterium]
MKQWRNGAVLMLLVVLVAVTVWLWRGAADELAPGSVSPDTAKHSAASVDVPDPAVANAPEYYRDIKSILDQRCVVCHGCYDAPCQLKLDSPEGIQRGATRAVVYDSARVLEAAPTRLFVDANSVAAWRTKDFFSVLNEGEQSSQSNLDNSILYRMLKLKIEQPLPEGPLPAAIDTSLDREAFCPRNDDFERYANEHPLQGMPFGLPPLSDAEFSKVKSWLETGARVATPPPLSTKAEKERAEWERFLNRSDMKSQLMARYVYEHLFLADLYFEGGDTREFFKLVRSRTPPGEPIDVIATRRPYDDPGVAHIYYR